MSILRVHAATLMLLWIPTPLALAQPLAPVEPPAATNDGESLDQTAEPTTEVSPEQQAIYETALLEFESARQALAVKVADQRELFLRYVNRIERTPAAKREYYQVRNEVRESMDELYRRALEVTRSGIVNEQIARYIVTMVQHRIEIGYYDSETFEGAAKMIDAGQNTRLLFVGAARSAVVSGNFDSAKRLLEVLLRGDQVEDIDKVLYSNLEEYEKQWKDEQKLRERESAEDRLPRVKLQTTQGDVVVELFLDQAPTAVTNFIQLVENDFYDGLDFFQVIDHSLALTGDSAGDGTGNSGNFIVDEHHRDDARNGFRGSLVMAKIPLGETGKFIPNSASSQFAILFMPIATVANQQTVFGRVVNGMDVVSRLQHVDPSKEKKEGEIVLPSDGIIEATVIRRPDSLPEPQYIKPQ